MPIRFRTVLTVALVSVIYFFAAKLGLHLATINNNASPVWPATGIAMGCVFLFGYRAGIGIFLAAFYVNHLTGIPTFASLMMGAGNALESVIGIFLFRRASHTLQSFGPHVRAVHFGFVAVVPTLISASLGTLALLLVGTENLKSASTSFITWWIGDGLGALIIFPLLYKLSKLENAFDVDWKNTWKLVLSYGLTIVCCYFVFDVRVGSPYMFLVFFPMLLTAFWFSSGWVYLNSWIVCVYSILKTTEALGPFANGSMNENLIHLQLFLAGVGLTAIVLVTLQQEGLLRRPGLVLMFGWLLTGMTFYSFQLAGIKNDEAHFQHKVGEANQAIQNSLDDYFRLLETGSALFAASESVEQEEWKAFTSKIRFESQYPGIEGLGVVFPEKSPLFKKQKISSRAVSKAEKKDLIDSPKDNLVLTYIEPYEQNRAAIGLNISSEKHRYEAVQRARDTGLPVMSDRIYLIQDSKVRPGFALIMPVYKKTANLDTIEDRRNNIEGYIVAPVVVEKFINASLRSFAKEVSLNVYFGTMDENHKVFDSQTGDKKETTKQKVIMRPVLGGLPVVFEWSRANGFVTQSNLINSWMGFFGSLISLLLAIIISTLESTKWRAEKIAEEKTLEVIERERVWRALTEVSPVGVYLVDAGGRCNYTNKTWCKLTGSSREEVIERGWIEMVHPEDVESLRAAWDGLKAGGTFHHSYRIRKPNGEIVHVDSQAVPLLNDQGVVTGYLGTIQDITELHHKQVALISSSRMSSLGEMASGIAHEINNPLAIISGNADYIGRLLKQEDINREKINEYVKKIIMNVGRISKIIRGLRTFARDVPDDPFIEVKAKDVIQDALELCRSKFHHHDVDLRIKCQIGDDVLFSARSEQIVQVLLNLLNNAFDAVQELPERWVEVEAFALDSVVQFRVRDSGRGIDERLQSKIFTPFFTTKEVGKGTGLGLSISKGIIEKHGGKLSLVQQESHTTFAFQIPASYQEQKVATL